MENAALVRASNLSLFEAATVNQMDVYVAKTDAQHKAGLAGLTKLDKAGMLFVYEEPSSTPFTMAKMLFDLDVSFYDKDGNLLKHGTYNAGYAGPVFCRDYSYVLESPAGFGHPESLDVAVVTDDGRPTMTRMEPPKAPATFLGDPKAQDRVVPVGSGDAVKEGAAEGAAAAPGQVGSGPWNDSRPGPASGNGSVADPIPDRAKPASQTPVASTPIPGRSAPAARKGKGGEADPIPGRTAPAPKKGLGGNAGPIPGSGSNASAEQEGAQMGDQPGMPSAPAQTFLS